MNKIRIIFGLFCVLFFSISVTAQLNPIQQENSLPGTRSWQIYPSYRAALAREIEGYASATSVNVGEPIMFHVSTRPAQRFKIEIYRLGWYNGDGGRLVHTLFRPVGRHQILNEADKVTGLIEQSWNAKYGWTPPPGTVSGNFVAKLISMTGYESYIPFVVRDDERTSDFLFQTAVTTYQAYNFYPGYISDEDWRSGKSLYDTLSFGPKIPSTVEPEQRNKQARAVSFNRPYFPNNQNIYNTAGQFFEWEYNMVRWMEKEGYDVTYQTDIDTHSNVLTLAPGKHKVFLSVGHDEYWSWEMRDNLEKARDRFNQPLNIGFFGANNVHWQIRFGESGEKSNPANEPNRTMISYKRFANNANPNLADPVFSDPDPTNNFLTTGYWSQNRTFGTACPSYIPNCYKDAEDELVGVMTDLQLVTGSGNFTFAESCPAWVKTGMSDPERAFNGLLGYEADRIFNLPYYYDRNYQIIGNSVFNNETGSINAHSVLYRKKSNGARVFAAGTTQWAWGLDEFAAAETFGPRWHANLYNSDLEVVTRNILACLRDSNATCGVTIEPTVKGR